MRDKLLKVLGPGLALLLYLFLLVGAALRHVPDGAIFGRYTALYLVGLVVFALGLIPFGWFVVSLTRESRVQTKSGRELVFTPGKKLKLTAMALVLIVTPTELYFWSKATRRTKRDMQQFHPFLQLQGRPNRASTHQNRHGFRGDELEVAKAKGTVRVFFLGGSTVYCKSMRDIEQTHVRGLERRLRERFPDRRLEVQNAGMEWYTTAHSLVNYQLRIKDFQPDLVILYHGINDLVRSFAPPKLSFGEFRRDYAHYYGPIAKLAFARHGKVRIPTPYTLDWLLAPGKLYSDLSRTRAAPVETFQSVGSFERNLRSIVAATRADGVALVLCTQPYLFRDDLNAEETKKLWMPQGFCAQDGVHPDAASMARGMKAMNEATRRVAAETKTPLVELAPAVPKTLEFFQDGVHYTAAGNARIAETVFRAIQEHPVFAN